ncbi:MAG: O-antigen ligase family protein, partial [Bacteroidota bacterium]
MPFSSSEARRGDSLPRAHLLAPAALVLPALVFSLNALDAGLPKLPLLVLGVTVLALALAAGGFRTGRFPIPDTRHMAAPLLLLMFGGVSALLSPFPRHAWPAFTLLLCGVVLLYGGAVLAGDTARIRSWFHLLACIIGGVVLFGVYEYLDSAGPSPDFTYSRHGRIGSTLVNPTYLAGFIALTVPLVAALAADGNRSRPIRSLFALLAAGEVIMLLFTRSRGGIAATAVGLAVFFLLTRRKRPGWIFPSLLILLLASGGVLLAPVMDRVLTSPAPSDASSTLARRVFFWDAGLLAFLDSPVFGHGVGSYETVMVRFRSPHYWIAGSEDLVPHAHNEIIEIAVESGLAGLALYGLLLVLVPGGALRTIGQLRGWNRTAAAALMGGLAGVLAEGMVGVALRQVPVAALVWLFLGLLSSPVLAPSAQPGSLAVPKLPGRAIWLLVPLAGAGLWYSLEPAIRTIRADRHLLAGILAVHEDRRQAIGELAAAVEEDPGLPLAQSTLALEYLKEGRAEESLRWITRLRRTYPQYPKSALIHAYALISLNRHREAVPVIEEEIALRTHPEAYYAASLAWKGLADTSAERECLRRLFASAVRGHTAASLG